MGTKRQTNHIDIRRNPMKNHKPRVSIGLPVYNGEKYLEAALDSILAQTFPDFELIINDNASTDRTPEICSIYANKDTRVRYYRNEKNRGAAWNFNRVFELSAGEYFCWVAHDDIIASDYISRCIEVLDKDDSVVLCNSRVQYIDENGDIIATYIRKLNIANSPNPRDRFDDIFDFDNRCLSIFGLIRSDTLRKTQLIKGYSGSDRVLLAELGLINRFYEIPQYLFFTREHDERSCRALPDNMRDGWFDTSKEGQIGLPVCKLLFEFFKLINRSSLGLYDKACCYVCIANKLRIYHRSMAIEFKDFLLFSVHHRT
jgi:glycosyltransferase involved in cell wall biosynthesis